MTIGKMRHRVTIQQPVRTSDGAGGYTTAWTTLAIVWAHLHPVKGVEINRADAIQGIADYTLTFRTKAAPTVDETMRATYASVTYTFVGLPVVDEVGRFTFIPLRKGVPS